MDDNTFSYSGLLFAPQSQRSVVSVAVLCGKSFMFKQTFWTKTEITNVAKCSCSKLAFFLLTPTLCHKNINIWPQICVKISQPGYLVSLPALGLCDEKDFRKVANCFHCGSVKSIQDFRYFLLYMGKNCQFRTFLKIVLSRTAKICKALR